MITRDEIEQIAVNAVKRAFRDMGINDGDPFEMRKDLAHLREWRTTCEAMRGRGILTIVGMAITGLAALILLGFKGWFIH